MHQWTHMRMGRIRGGYLSTKWSKEGGGCEGVTQSRNQSRHWNDIVWQKNFSNNSPNFTLYLDSILAWNLLMGHLLLLSDGVNRSPGGLWTPAIPFTLDIFSAVFLLFLAAEIFKKRKIQYFYTQKIHQITVRFSQLCVWINSEIGDIDIRGFEPATYGTQVQCSTTELSRL